MLSLLALLLAGSSPAVAVPAELLDPTLAPGFVDRAAPCCALARGEVVSVRGSSGSGAVAVLVRHRWLENHEVREAWALHEGLVFALVAAGQGLEAGESLGPAGDQARVRLASRPEDLEADDTAAWEAAPLEGDALATFLARRGELVVPASEPDLLVIDKSEYTLWRLEAGRVVETLEVALSQQPLGHKQVRGDNRLPEGSYRVIQRSRGPFTGAVGPWFGVAWMRLSYPNDFDADAGLADGRISEDQHDAILAANAAGRMPPKTTRLGGGIGIHGWNGDWPALSRDLTWGCLSVQNGDLDRLYDEVPLGTPVIIRP